MSGNCWEVLELAADSDERSVKRRYAQLLKRHRPEESPSAFQALREAYEQALLAIRWRQDYEQDSSSEEQSEAGFAPLELNANTAEIKPKESMAPACLEVVTLHEQERSLEPEVVAMLAEATPASLDACLAQAEAEGYRLLFEQHLLTLCLSGREDALAMTEWALRRLHWLTPWQILQISEATGNYLLERWLHGCLKTVQNTLAQNPSTAAKLLVEAAQSPWLSAFDQQNWFQQHLVHWLLDEQSWTPTFFEQLANGLGWYIAGQEPPCPAWQWQQLLQRCDEFELLRRLRGHINDFWPCSAEARAAWLLLKPLAPSECRVLVEHFDDNDWKACSHLSDLLEYRYQGVLEQLSEKGLRDWREWQPGPGWGNLDGMVWLLFFLVHLAVELSGLGVFSAQTGWSALIDAIWVASIGFLLSRLLYRGWRFFARKLTEMDVRLSNALLPQVLNRQGAGILLLRHGVSAAGLGLLSAGMSRLSLPYSLLLSGVVFCTGLAFVHYSVRLPAMLIDRWLADLVQSWKAHKEALWVCFTLLLIYWGMSLIKVKPEDVDPASSTAHCEQYASNMVVRNACIKLEQMKEAKRSVGDN